jgi:hypothetical protein
MMSAFIETPVIFDEFSKIRVFDPEHFDTSLKLKEEIIDFSQSYQF